MKILILLIIPFYLFSNNIAYRDSLFLKTGKTLSCLIKEIDDNVIKLDYGNQVTSGIAIKMLKRFYVWELGNVYYDTIGFKIEIDSIRNFINLRNKHIIQENIKNEKNNEEVNKKLETIVDDTSSFYPILGVRYGKSELISASTFMSAYNNPNAFTRPWYQTSSKWPKFDPFKSTNTFAIEFGMLLKNGLNIGVSYESKSLNEKDDFSYWGLVGVDQNNNPLYFDIDESYTFDAKVSPILLFINYRFLGNFTVYPEIGIGLGVGLTKFKWAWHIYGSKIINGTKYYFDDNRIWFEEEEKKFIYQPKVRINLNISKIDRNIGKYLDTFYLQFDYTNCQSTYDIFKYMRDEILEYMNEEDILPSYKRTLFQKYDVDWGGFQVKLGLIVKTLN